MSKKHAKFSASASSRWLNCPGSVKIYEQYTKSSTTSFAEEGTCAHELAEICLLSGDDPKDYLGQTLNDAPGVKVDSEMIGYVQGYIDYCNSFNGYRMVEQRVDYSNWIPDGFGTADFFCIGKGGVCDVVDLKYGKGLVVDAFDNTQGMLYCIGILNEFDFLHDIEKFNIHIYQPRVNNISEWSITTEDLIKFAKLAKRQAELALTDNAPIVAGEKQCQWCAHKNRCPALLKHTEEVISAEFDDLDELGSPNEISQAQVKLILDNKKLIESWLKAVEELAFDKLMSGEEVEGYKLVEGRSIRKWANQEEAVVVLESMLGADAFERKLLTPAKATKALGKNKGDIEALIVKPDGKPTLAPASDKRKPFGDVSCEFEEISK